MPSTGTLAPGGKEAQGLRSHRHTTFRSFLLFSRARGLVWKWPDPRESNPLELPDGQKISCRPTCLVAASEKTSFKWLVDHLTQRYPTLPDIRVWEPPDDED